MHLGMSEKSDLILSPSLGEFFREEITDARDGLGIELEECVEYYLVNLLCNYSTSSERPLPGDEPLAFLYKRAIEAQDTIDRIQHLRDLGDLALYSAGFFAENIQSSMVDVDYYVSMGGNAYSGLANLVGGRRNGEGMALMYNSLGSEFPVLVGLLNYVEERYLASGGDQKNLMKLYSRWLKTGHPRLYKLLLEQGFVTAFTAPDERLQ